MSAWQQDGYDAYGDQSAYQSGGQPQQVEIVEAARPVISTQAARVKNQRVSADSTGRSVRSGQGNVRQSALGAQQARVLPPQGRRSVGNGNNRIDVGTHARTASSRFLGPHLW